MEQTKNATIANHNEIINTKETVDDIRRKEQEIKTTQRKLEKTIEEVKIRSQNKIEERNNRAVEMLEEFKEMFLHKFWGKMEQSKIRRLLVNGKYKGYENSREIYATKIISQVRQLFPPMDEKGSNIYYMGQHFEDDVNRRIDNWDQRNYNNGWKRHDNQGPNNYDKGRRDQNDQNYRNEEYQKYDDRQNKVRNQDYRRNWNDRRNAGEAYKREVTEEKNNREQKEDNTRYARNYNINRGGGGFPTRERGNYANRGRNVRNNAYVHNVNATVKERNEEHNRYSDDEIEVAEKGDYEEKSGSGQDF
ncbi:hypothetical protein RI129_008048 [Pyrocoelia pectoralis]|uniref:Uncharacterized protein n=1 Tax=Pyrocoelia pectoralis TaxID=417401 RepID=A0AAN7VCA5_9COLE